MITGAYPVSLVKLIMLQEGKVDCELSDIHAAAGSETADIKTGSPEQQFPVTDFESPMSI